MAKIKIGGKLTNVQDVKGTIADASQINVNGTELSVDEKLAAIDENISSVSEGVAKSISDISSNIDSINSTISTLDTEIESVKGLETEIDANKNSISDINNEISSIKSIQDLRKFSSIEAAELALKEKIISLGDMFTVDSGASEGYTIDFKLYVVAQDIDNKVVLRELSGGSSSDATGKVILEVSELLIDGVAVDATGASVLEANIGSKINIKYNFSSLLYPDALGTVIFRRGATDIFRESVYPDDYTTYELPTYTVENIPAGNYTFTIYGQDKTKQQSARTRYNILIGGLTVESTFSDKDAIKAGDIVKFPINVTAADDSATVEAVVSINNHEYTRIPVKAGSNQIEIPTGSGTQLDIGNNIVEIKLENSKGKISNILKYNITVAEEGIIYLTLPTETITSSEGSRLEIPLRILQLNFTDETYDTQLTIKNSQGDSVYSQNYLFSHGSNIATIIGLDHSSEVYTAEITVVGTSEENLAASVSGTLNIFIEENNYNISFAGSENLLCSFNAAGKSNSSVDRDTWIDDSGNGVIATFNNFNWVNNGWLPDEKGDTALTLDAGAYVEIDIRPFLNDIAAGEAITLSIDFSTKDVLDSEAKVVSCLKEQSGEDKNEFFLRDILGEFVKNDIEGVSVEESNIVKFFKNSGGYCWVDGITYGTDINPVDPNIEYETAVSINERTPNYNLGDDNPAYDGETDFRKKLGYEVAKVTKQTGFYIDTQYAVLTNPASPANVLEKFYLNFSENTRTRIDFIITRASEDNISENPYSFKSMIGYTNGILSLMKALPDNDSFKHNGKIYLGCKGLYDSNNRLTVSQTGSSKIYSFRIYNRALTPAEIVRNYAASLTDQTEKESVIDNNGILNVDSIAKLPYMELIGYRYPNVGDDRPDVEKYSIYKFIMQLLSGTGMSVSDLKNIKEPGYIRYYDPVQEKFWGINDDWTDKDDVIPARLQFQGTSSMVYPVKNYKVRLHKTDHIMGADGIEYGKKLKKDIGNGNSESTFCLKADYMDSSHCNNTGSANFISDYNKLSGKTPASELDDSFRTTIYGYPILLYYRRDALSTERHFIGVYNLNLDKSCTGSFGFEEELEDSDKNVYNFSKIRFIDDELTKDILDRIEIPFSDEWELTDNMEILVREESEQVIKECPQYSLNGKPVAVKNGDVYYKLTMLGDDVYVSLQNPASGVECALLTKEGFILAVDGTAFSSTQCFEFKANSGATGAGGFGNYALDSISKDLENRYPDDGDLEDENYSDYVKSVGSENAIDFSHYRAPLYYNIRRNIKWLRSSSKDDFRTNVYKYYDITYMLDYYLTIMLLGGVDSLGKNLMVASWGPENHLYEVSEGYDNKTFQYTDPYDNSVKFFTPTKTVKEGESEYIYAKNSKGQHLYFKESVYNRYEKKFIGEGSWNQDIVTTVPGEGIQRPIFYDIDTINGLDNSGQLLFDCDIEIGDILDDGTAVFNTDDSNLWRRIRDYMPAETSSRWQTLRNAGYFTLENLVGKFYHERQISKIPETYYNQDCFLKYIYEGPVAPGEVLPNGDIASRGGGTYLYCIHGSRYEHMKRWYGQRIKYIDSMFGIMDADSSSLRFNHALYDANYVSEKEYYGSYAQLAAKYPDNYYYNAETGKLQVSVGGREISPINFNIKTYQPGYVGVKWSKSSDIIYYRLGRDQTVNIKGNVPSAGDSEVFIYGGTNVKDIGDMNPYNVKQVDFKNMTKLSKLILGGDKKCVINKLDLGVNTYLTELNLRTCTNLLTVDLTNCTNIRNVYMARSGVSSISLPVGGALESIEYSDAITSINLNGFINLSSITIGSLGNMTSLIIEDCPKILGSETLRSPKAWSILQQTKSTDVDEDTKVSVTSYGDVEPVIYPEGEFFFPDHFWEHVVFEGKKANINIAGEISYKGYTIPTNYAKFGSVFPKLRIFYPNIRDASGMFEDYKNINTVTKVNVIYGEDSSGLKTKDVYCWNDTTDELIEKWYKQEMYDKYGASTTYNEKIGFYRDQSTGKYYRLLTVYDKEDLDGIRKQIKDNIAIFNGGKFTNINRMFKGLAILDYIDPDTFNEIDISDATTEDLFSGCKSLKYFTLPGDIIKNRPVYRYFDENGVEVPEVEYNPENPKEHKTNENGELLYTNDLTGETTEITTIYKKGLRKINRHAFYECRNARVLIKKVSNEDTISIDPNAFEYVLFNPKLESQPSGITCQRPVIMFEHSAMDILAMTTEAASEKINNIPSEVDNLYYVANTYGERTINFENTFVDFKNSNTFMREVYFDVDRIVRDENIDEKYAISYALKKDNSKILIDVKSYSSTLDKFNVNGVENGLNIYSVVQGAFENIADICDEIQAPLPKYDCLDTVVPRCPYEKHIISLFTSSNITALDDDSLYNALPKFKWFHLVNTKEIPVGCFRSMSNIEYVSADNDLEIIGENAFENCIELTRLFHISDISNVNNFETTKKLKIKEIRASAFSGCTSYGSSLYLPETVETLGRGSFAGCSNLERVTMSPLIVEIPENCFNNCSKLNSFTGLSKSTRVIENSAFRYCEQLSIIGNVNESVFGGSLGGYTSLERIGDFAFERCNKLTASVSIKDPIIIKFEIPESLKYIGVNAFYQDLKRAAECFIEFIWIGKNYSGLTINSGAFTNVRTAWTPVGYSQPITDIIYVPKVAVIGSNAFKSRSSDTMFKFAITDMTQSIGRAWVSDVAKIIYNYAGMNEVNGTTYILSDDGVEKTAYLQYIHNSDANIVTIPVSINYDSNEYYIKEILKGSLDAIGNGLSTIIFYDRETYGSKLELIETGVLKSDSLLNIITISRGENGSDIQNVNVIPDGLTIASGNNFKNTLWYNLRPSNTVITLGKYIIGYREDGENLTSIDFGEYPQCSTIYDSAFASLSKLENINITDNIESIYSNAFTSCISISEVTLPRSLKTLGSGAFAGCPITNIFIPNSITDIGAAPFGSFAGRKGTLESVIIENGSTIKTLPFSISQEIMTNDTLGGPKTANISLKHVHIPASMPTGINMNDIKQLSQAYKLTLGNLKVNDDGTYLFDNYPLYIDPESGGYVFENTGEIATDPTSGKQLYCPRFYHDMMTEAGFESSIIFTTEPTSYYPYGDEYDSDGNLVSYGYSQNIDIGFIMRYPNATSNLESEITSADIRACRDLTTEDIMRIVAGFTKTKPGSVYQILIRKADYERLSIMEVLAASNYKIKFVPYANR